MAGIRTPAKPFAVPSCELCQNQLDINKSRATDNTYGTLHSHHRRPSSSIKYLFYIYPAAGGTAYSFLNSMASTLMAILEPITSERATYRQLVHLCHAKKRNASTSGTTQNLVCSSGITRGSMGPTKRRFVTNRKLSPPRLILSVG